MKGDCLGLFAKYWKADEVKTRLAVAIGAQRAADVYHQFVATLLDRLSGCGERRWLAYSPAQRASEFQELVSSEWQIEPQSEGDLGHRMKCFLKRRFEEGFRQVVLLGSDSPDVPLEYVSKAFDLLRQRNVVLGPTEDGGYWLIGATGEVPEVFDTIPWSTPQVWSATLAALDTAGLSHAELPTWYDVDEQKDLNRLIDNLQQPTSEPALHQLRDALARLEQAS